MYAEMETENFQTKTEIIGGPTIFGKFLLEIIYMLVPQKVVRKTYARTKGKLWAVLARNKYHVFVSTQSQIENFSAAPINDLSLQEASYEILPLELHGGVPVGCTPGNLGLWRSTIGSNLRGCLWSLQPLFHLKMIKGLEEEFKAGDFNTEYKVGLNSFAYGITIKINALMIVGENLRTALMKYGGNIDELAALVREEVVDRWDLPTEHCKTKYMDCIQWTMERAKSPTIEGVLCSFSLYTLCKHPEYLEPLRKEAKEATNTAQDAINDGMPLLDSFLKEVARCNPIATVTMPHKVMKPFTFSDGASVPVGNFICIPSAEIMGNEAIYPNASKFDGFRFVESNKSETTGGLKFSHPSWKFPYWGTVKQACPGRFYAALVAKMFISHFITHYDFKLADENVAPKFHWGIASVPHPRLAILVQHRKQEG
ncbi:Cytochrome P450 monooxygenase paxQ [Lachnellula arida]|uniref:Cytochrome P450 monooxygenase paxQ n=1 Tax=Lachnellula arida TaxID=1316785 RepID=A0A8T9BPA9_9HELO|nr:Cytochrome P450 monooxygenase paxQ [Lachnellula arida]